EDGDPLILRRQTQSAARKDEGEGRPHRSAQCRRLRTDFEGSRLHLHSPPYSTSPTVRECVARAGRRPIMLVHPSLTAESWLMYQRRRTLPGGPVPILRPPLCHRGFVPLVSLPYVTVIPRWST